MRCFPRQERQKPPGVWDPGGVVCGSSCFDRTFGRLDSEVWQTQQFERVGVPLSEEIVHLGLQLWLLQAQREATAMRTLH